MVWIIQILPDLYFLSSTRELVAWAVPTQFCCSVYNRRLCVTAQCPVWVLCRLRVICFHSKLKVSVPGGGGIWKGKKWRHKGLFRAFKVESHGCTIYVILLLKTPVFYKGRKLHQKQLHMTLFKTQKKALRVLLKTMLLLILSSTVHLFP